MHLVLYIVFPFAIFISEVVNSNPALARCTRCNIMW